MPSATTITAGARSARPAGSAKPIPSPRRAPDPGSLPHALTFFLTAAQRTAVLRTLRRTNPDRTRALLARLRLSVPPARPYGATRRARVPSRPLHRHATRTRARAAGGAQ